MNNPTPPEAGRLPEEEPPSPRPPVPVGTAGYVWESRYGSMRIEVVDGTAYVNGRRVEPFGAQPGGPRPAQPE